MAFESCRASNESWRGLPPTPCSKLSMPLNFTGTTIAPRIGASVVGERCDAGRDKIRSQCHI